MTWSPIGGRLSASAQARLREYTSELEARIIAEAETLNPSDVLTSRDIGDAYETYRNSERKAQRYSIAHGSPWRRVILIYSAAAGATALVSFGVLIAAQFTDFAGEYIYFIGAMLAALSGALSVSITFLVFSETRRSRARALELAEAGSHEAELALYVAEAVRSASRSGADSTQMALLTGRFISQWARVEDHVRRLAHVAAGMSVETAADYPIGSLLKTLTMSGIFTEALVSNLRSILDIRNQIAHGGQASIAELTVGLDMMNELETFLDDYLEQHSVDYRNLRRFGPEFGAER